MVCVLVVVLWLLISLQTCGCGRKSRTTTSRHCHISRHDASHWPTTTSSILIPHVHLISLILQPISILLYPLNCFHNTKYNFPYCSIVTCYISVTDMIQSTARDHNKLLPILWYTMCGNVDANSCLPSTLYPSSPA